MADDLHRDLLPLRENSYVESFRGSIIDPRERLIVGKLNRRDLEDKYLRLFEDYQEIKKSYNSQEDKIKRLSTKLMRVCTTPRLMNCGPYNGNNERDRISSLMLENSKLKEKVNILRNQILSHRVLSRPSSHNKRLQVCHSSAVTSYRSDSPIKVAPCQNCIAENNEIQHYIMRVKELENQKKKLMNRITELEKKIEMDEAGNQKEKIAENVEYIRVWRQMKLQDEKCVETEAKNKALTEEIETLRDLLDETSRNHGEITEKFRAEKELTSELKEQVSRAQSIEADLRERDEKIRILSSELKMIQDHKNQMVELNKRDSSTEIENGQLKKKLSDIMADNISLKTAFNAEQANIASLQSVNAQLREKLQDLQASVDVLTVKLNAFEKQTSRDYIPKSPVRPKPAERTSHPVLLCECTTDDSEVHLAHSSPKVQRDNGKKKTKLQSPVKKTHNYSESSMQTEFRLIDWKNGNQREDKACSTEDCPNSPLRSSTKIYENTLTPEKMLKLLDDAQINSPLSSQSVSKIGLEDIGSTSYGNPIRRQSSSSRDSSISKVNILDHCQFIDTVCGLLKDYWRINCRQTHKFSSAAVNTDFHRDKNNNNASLDICKCIPTSLKKDFSTLICTDEVDKYFTKHSNKLISEIASSTFKDQKTNSCAVDCPRRIKKIICPAFPKNLQSKLTELIPHQKNLVLCRRLCEECKELIKPLKNLKINNNNNNKDSMTIKIDRLKLMKNCPLLEDPDVHQLYVEFSFLGYSGLNLETISVAKPKDHTEELSFNYSRKFFFDEETHKTQRIDLCKILAGDGNSIVRFNIISEPLREEMEIKDCVEIGYARLNLRKQILYKNKDNILLSVMSSDNKDIIGTLEVTLLGLDSIRENLAQYLPINGSSPRTTDK